MARPNIGDLIPIGAVGNATKDKVLSPYTFSSEPEGVEVVGTMPNKGAISRTITTQNGTYIVPAGYHDGSGIVKAQFANLTASNIKKGVKVGGVTGTFDPSITGTRVVNDYGTVSRNKTYDYSIPTAYRDKLIVYHCSSSNGIAYGVIISRNKVVSRSSYFAGSVSYTSDTITFSADSAEQINYDVRIFI